MPKHIPREVKELIIIDIEKGVKSNEVISKYNVSRKTFFNIKKFSNEYKKKKPLQNPQILSEKRNGIEFASIRQFIEFPKIEKMHIRYETLEKALMNITLYLQSLGFSKEKISNIYGVSENVIREINVNHRINKIEDMKLLHQKPNGGD